MRRANVRGKNVKRNGLEVVRDDVLLGMSLDLFAVLRVHLLHAPVSVLGVCSENLVAVLHLDLVGK